MRVIGIKNINTIAGKTGKTRQALLSWYYEVKNAAWSGPKHIRHQYTEVVVVSGTRVVFPVYGNSYQVVADINYGLQLVQIIWIGTTKSFEAIDVKKIIYA
jgi:mRNA-degrading endonuclease HigB of HigAB toxin-antitoxin module